MISGTEIDNLHGDVSYGECTVEQWTPGSKSQYTMRLSDWLVPMPALVELCGGTVQAGDVLRLEMPSRSLGVIRNGVVVFTAIAPYEATLLEGPPALDSFSGPPLS